MGAQPGQDAACEAAWTCNDEGVQRDPHQAGQVAGEVGRP